MLHLLLGPPEFNCWISFAPLFKLCVQLSNYLCFSSFYILINMYCEIRGSFVWAKHLCVLIHIGIKAEVGAVKLV